MTAAVDMFKGGSGSSEGGGGDKDARCVHAFRVVEGTHTHNQDQIDAMQ